jgi:hypothetical protein
MPRVPPEANAACAAKKPGDSVVWQLEQGGTMRGTCARRNGRMVMQLRSYTVDH